MFRPKECDRLILYLKDLNLARPDKYGTCMLIAFLQQILTYGGFYDNLEWVGLEAVQIVGSMSSSGGGTGLGRHQLSTRFTSVLRVVAIGQPDKVNKICTVSFVRGYILTNPCSQFGFTKKKDIHGRYFCACWESMCIIS